jgi:hypothetical protein
MNTYYTIEPTQQSNSNTFSSWQPEGLSNNAIKSNWNYRQYMQKNANQIMKYNTMQTISASGNNPFTILNTQPVDTSPYLYNSVHDNSEPIYKSPVNSDLKHDYLLKEQMKARMIAPSIPTNF